MPKPTVTVRELHNTDSGLDLSIPSQEETPGLLGSTVSYHVVAVTCLSCYKSPSHKPTDTVQFMVSRQLGDFEKLQKSMAAAFPGTVLPTLPKRGVPIVGSANNTARRMGLQDFLSAIASVPKMATSAPLLEFLGVSSLKTGGVRGDGPKEDSHDIFEEFREKDGPLKKPPGGLFEDLGDDDDDDDLFGTKKTSLPLKMDDEELELFKTPREKPTRLRSGSAQLFIAEDITLTDEQLKQMAGDDDNAAKAELEDNSELLNNEDDLDDILKLSEKKPPPDDSNKKSPSDTKPTVKPKPKPSPKPKPDLKPKPSPPGPKPSVKPKPAAKPDVPTKPKPVASVEEKKDDLFASTPDNEEDLFGPSNDNKKSAKPSKTKATSATSDLFSSVADEKANNLFASASDEKDEDPFSSSRTDLPAAQDDFDDDLFGSEPAPSKNVDTDDIMKYIQENVQRQDEDLDLFS